MRLVGYITFIWETGQQICNRRDHHKRDVKHKKSSNALNNHMKNNEGYEKNWEKTCVLDKQKNRKGTKLKNYIHHCNCSD